MLLYVHAFTRIEPMSVFRKAIELASPSVRVLSFKERGKVTPMPVALSEKQRVRDAIDAILAASKSRAGNELEERLAREVVAVVAGDSPALKKKAEQHRQTMVNRGNIRMPRKR